MLSLKKEKPTLKENKPAVIDLVAGAAIRSCLFTFLLVSAWRAHAQVSAAEYYNTIDNKVYTFSKAPGQTFDSLIRFVNTQFRANRDKVRAFYTWIALNISYDKELLDRYQLNAGLGLRALSSSVTQHPDTVLKYRKAVCEGFSLLMNKCCERCAIPATMVIGPTRLEDGEVTDKILHAWNAVKVDTAWYLLDVTWSNGYVNQMNEYKKKFSDKYFFTPPAEFAEDHLPLDPMWQLNHYPVSKRAFYSGSAGNTPVFFNYKDSIAAYMALKPDTLEYVSFLHYHAFDPENDTYTRECDRILHDRMVTYLNLAAVYYDDYQRYANKYNGKVVNEKIVRQCIKLLQEPRKYLVTGLNYAKNKQFFHPDIRESFDKMTASASQNLKEVDLAIENHRNFAKGLKTSKK